MQLSEKKTDEEQMGNNMTLYLKYWRPFGELLTDMERTGIKIDINLLRNAELTALKEQKEYQDHFLNWVWSTLSSRNARRRFQDAKALNEQRLQPW